MRIGKRLVLIGLAFSIFVASCQKQNVGHTHNGDHSGGPAADAKTKGDEEADIQAVRAELSADERRLVDAQDYCPIMPDQRLGSMGKPFKVMIKDQSVFLCCKGCQRKALADPDKTLARVEKLKARAKERENDSQ